jgi:hypothetical protein
MSGVVCVNHATRREQSNIQGTFREHSGNIQGTLSERLANIRPFREHTDLHERRCVRQPRHASRTVERVPLPLREQGVEEEVVARAPGVVAF